MVLINEHYYNISNNPNYNEVYIIAEIGINHNGNYYTARRLIQEAKEAGVDAVKFQKRDLESIYTKGIIDDPNSAEWNFEYLMPILKESELTVKELKSLKEYAEELELEFIITPFDLKSVKDCNEIGVSAFKIGSMDMVNYDLILECQKGGKVLIISTGMWSEKEIKDAVDRYDDLQLEYILLLANSTYPTPYESINLGFLDKLKEMHSLVGYSGHERGGFIPIAAVAKGCSVIEKHITLDRDQTGPDHKASMLPSEFKEMVTNIRNLEKSLGSKKIVNQAESLAKQTFVKSAYVTKDFKIGDKVKMSDVVWKSPGKGIFRHNINEFVDKELKSDIYKGQCLTENHYEDIIHPKDWNLPKFSKDWGVKCRFHDYDDYETLNSPVIEFHMSQKDLDINFNKVNKKSQLVVHAPEIFDRKLVDICSNNKDIVNGSLDILQSSINKTIEISKNFGNKKPKFVVHLGGMSLEDVLNPNEEMLCRAIDNFKKLKFNPDDIEILPETLPPRPWYFGGQYFQYGFMTSEDMIRFCEYFNLNMTLDVCHSALYCNHSGKKIEDYIKEVKHLVSHVHLSDATGIDGEGVQIGEGELNFNNITNVLNGKDFSWVTEIWSGHLNKGAGCRKSMHLLSKYNKIL